MMIRSAIPSVSDLDLVMTGGAWSAALTDGPVLGRQMVASVTGTVIRVLDFWGDVLFCSERLAVATLRAGAETTEAMETGLWRYPQGLSQRGIAGPTLQAAELCWAVAEAACLPYRDASGQISVRLAQGVPGEIRDGSGPAFA